MTEHALVLLSGGQDSTTCLAWALDRFDKVETIGFDYAQRHRVELDCREIILSQIESDFPQWSGRLGEDHMIDARILAQVSHSALTHALEIKMERGLPNTFVPGRNLLFFTLASAIAYRRGIKHLVGGMCETDYSGYPDCRDDTLKALQVTLNLGMDARFVIHTPLMCLSKKNTWRLADHLGGQQLVDLIIAATHTCYHGDREHKHDWGWGCGDCPACDIRAKGWTAVTGEPAV